MANLVIGRDAGTCTLAIVMVQDFPSPALLPGGPKTGPKSDFSSWVALWKIADNLVRQCVVRRGEMGWQQAGMFLLFSFCYFVSLLRYSATLFLYSFAVRVFGVVRF